MPRVTITLSEERYRALKETAARRRTSIKSLIDESLDLAGIKTREDAAELVERARLRSGLDDDVALTMAVEETRTVRG